MGTPFDIHDSPGQEYQRLGPFERQALSDRESSLLASTMGRPISIDAGHEFAVAGTLLNRPKYIISGWVGLSRLLDDGRRQIVDLQIAGEFTAFDARPGAVSMASYVTLTPVRLIELGDLVAKTMSQSDALPVLATIFHAANDEARCRLIDQTVRLGRMLAHERMAHLALELYRRFDRVGLCAAQSFPMPLTQEALGDVLGMSTVHVNRTLQQLRREGLLKTASGRWEILDRQQMTDVASGARAGNF